MEIRADPEEKKLRSRRKAIKKAAIVLSGIAIIVAVSYGGRKVNWLMNTPEGHAYARMKTTQWFGRYCGEVLLQAGKERFNSLFEREDFVYTPDVFRYVWDRDQEGCVSARFTRKVEIDLDKSMRESVAAGIELFEAKNRKGEMLFHQLRICKDSAAKMGLYANLQVGNPDTTIFENTGTERTHYLFIGSASTMITRYVGVVDDEASREASSGNRFNLPIFLNGKMHELEVGGKLVSGEFLDNAMTIWKTTTGEVVIDFIRDRTDIPSVDQLEWATQTSLPLIIEGEIVARIPGDSTEIPEILDERGNVILGEREMEMLYVYFASQVRDAPPVVYGITADGGIIITVLTPEVEMKGVLDYLKNIGVVNAFGGDLNMGTSTIVNSSGERLVYTASGQYRSRDLDPGFTDGWFVFYLED